MSFLMGLIKLAHVNFSFLSGIMKFGKARRFLLTVIVTANSVEIATATIPVVATNTLPASCSDAVGSQVIFKAAFSSDSPMTYQWQDIRDGVTNNIPGATNTTLVLTDLQLTNTASYQLQASNVSGSTCSAPSSLTVNLVPQAVNNIITSVATQTGLGPALTNFAPTWEIASGSLIAGQLPSDVGVGDFSDPYRNECGGVSVLTDDSFGWLKYLPNLGGSPTEVTGGTVAGGAGQSVTYTLTGSSTGYDLTNITVYGGWGDAGRDQQAYTVYYSTISAPTTYIQLSDVNYNPSDPANVQSATRVALRPASGLLATNVAAVKFDFTNPAGENGYSGYSEIQVFGKPTPVPGPVVSLPVGLPSSSVEAGTSVTLTEIASGKGVLQYQWQSDSGSGDGIYTDIPDATSSNYVVNTSSFGNNTISYRVQVTDQDGSVISPALPITITDPSVLTMAATNLHCEHLHNPLGIDVITPRLSWINNLPERGGRQTACQVLVASSPALLAQNVGDLWNSGKVTSDRSVLVPYAGSALASGEACYWKVRVWDESGNCSAWSPSAMWSMGLLKPSDWKAQWIGMNENTNISPAPPSPMLRKTFTVSKPVARATAYICGLGYYELQINGSKIGDDVLDPTWTRYDYHAYYTTYDVTTNLVQGQNAIGVQLANGYYNQWTGDAWNTATAPWRALPQMIMQLDIQYTDGTSNMVVSDPSWKVSTGPLVLDTTRLGEVYDARLEKPGWSTADYDDSSWTNAIAREGIAGSLQAPDAQPIKVFQTIHPVRIIPVQGQPGVYTFDFGQNLVGWGKLTVSGPAGTTVNMIYGELTNSDSSVNQNNINVYVNLKSYFQKDTYILKGDGTETYAPRFTYHGFRYAQVSGLPSAPTTNILVAQTVHTAFSSAGSFLCSNDLLNRMETNTLWSYLGNFVGIPTDCPTREKNGWDGDAQLACEVGLTHFHTAAAYTRWLREFGPGQLANGELSGVFPNANWGYGEGPAWESAILLIPWFVYEHCGDERILTSNYATMKAYVDYETSVASNNIVSYGLGDWEPAGTVTPASVTDTGYYYEDAWIVAQTAALMGNTADALQYSNLAAQIKVSFNNTFYDPTTSKYAGGTQTAQSCALYQGLVGSNQIPAVADALATLVQQNGNTIDTGILGSKYLLRALCDNGHSDTAMALALQTNYPGWGNWVLRGATTLWETWSGNGATDSHNHIMFGDISAWFMEYLAGIRPGAPGYKTVIIKPEITGAIAWARGIHDSPYGTISSAWQISGQTVTLDITIPPTSTGIVCLPTLGTTATNLVIQESGINIWTNGAPADNDPGVVYDHPEGTNSQTYLVWDVPSGSYHFSWTVSPVPNGLSAQAGNGWIGLNWSPTPGATSYDVKRAATSGGPYHLLASSILTPSFKDFAVTDGQTYYYVISAVGTSGESADSAEASATPSGNFSFEFPVVGGYEYDPLNAVWTFSGASPNGSGLIANGSAFGNPNAVDGMQAAFVQSHGTISQTLSGFVPGTNYTITYSAAQRSGDNQHGGESWNVTVDNTVIQLNNPGGTSYTDYTAHFVASAPRQTLGFVGTDLATGDNTVFIDDVRISPPLLQSQPSSATLTSPASGARFLSSSTIHLAATVVTNENVINEVQFYADKTNLIGQSGMAPYTCSWTNVFAGDYDLFARVIFNGDGIADSATADIAVTNLPPVLSGIKLGTNNQGLVISGTGQAEHTYVLDAATNLDSPVSWLPLLTNPADNFGNIYFTQLQFDKARQFFRIAAP
jgi:alpha-L-rhamnosidase